VATEIIRKVWCDLCLHADQHQEADGTHVVSVTPPGRTPRPLSLDLCDIHAKELLTPVVLVLEEYGAPVGDELATRRRRQTANRGPADIPEGQVPKCQVPGCDNNRGRGFTSYSSFGAHIRQQHGLTIVEYRDEYGPEGAVTAAPTPEQFNVGEEFKCPDCDNVYSVELGNNRPAQALGVHRAKTHGYKGVGK
jgi:hypothetical protein